MNLRKDVLIAPSLLSANFSRLGEEVSDVESAGADWLHVDVMDGMFVPNLTIGPLVISGIKKVTRVPLDVHLMIMDPGRYITDFHAAGADILHVHPEATPHLHRVLGRIRESGMKAGVALNPATGLETIRHVLPELDVIMIMTVNPGFGGQMFIENMLPKVTAAKKMIEEYQLDVLIEVDGGVTPGNARTLIQHGADVLVAGSSVFGRPPYDLAIKSLKDGPAAS